MAKQAQTTTAFDNINEVAGSAQRNADIYAAGMSEGAAASKSHEGITAAAVGVTTVAAGVTIMGLYLLSHLHDQEVRVANADRRAAQYAAALEGL